MTWHEHAEGHRSGVNDDGTRHGRGQGQEPSGATDVAGPDRRRLQEALLRLHAYLRANHWTGSAVAGPDVGVRFNSRIGRFVKGYLSFVPWRDDLVHAQTQRYWIEANWRMYDLGLGKRREVRAFAERAASYLRQVQTAAGYWEYPNPEWRGRIATVEGNYGTLGMLQTYVRTGEPHLLEGARAWYRYSVEHIGFQRFDGTLAINYFGNVPGGRVPNNTASTLPTFAAIATATADDRYLEHCPPMVRFLREWQLPSGELPYLVPGEKDVSRFHFLCYQYNAFEFLNLASYYQITGDDEILPVLRGLADYLGHGLTEDGAARYDCSRDRPELPYYTAAVGAALRLATRMGFGDHGAAADRAFARVIGQQREDGSFFHSTGNYGFLMDRRSYPRNLAMIASHLLAELDDSGPLTSIAAVTPGERPTR